MAGRRIQCANDGTATGARGEEGGGKRASRKKAAVVLQLPTEKEPVREKIRNPHQHPKTRPRIVAPCPTENNKPLRREVKNPLV